MVLNFFHKEHSNKNESSLQVATRGGQTTNAADVEGNNRVPSRLDTQQLTGISQWLVTSKDAGLHNSRQHITCQLSNRILRKHII